MTRLRSTAPATSKVSLSVIALLLLSPPLAAQDTTVADYDESMLQIEFHDNSPYAQVSRIRNISLLTLSDSRRSRWFIGINSDGIFGLHYRARVVRKSESDPVRLQFLDRYLTFDAY
ncbi:MAG: hypothetical protein K0U72_12370 [Gammaproteobacteria bacterium]|nr:hypothetical protein [Gammaproteobacteria bacterium]